MRSKAYIIHYVYDLHIIIVHNIYQFCLIILRAGTGHFNYYIKRPKEAMIFNPFYPLFHSFMVRNNQYYFLFLLFFVCLPYVQSHPAKFEIGCSCEALETKF